jgi:ATP-dependent helicase HrpA
MQLRAERAALAPAKDSEKARQLAPFHGWERRVAPARHAEFRWMLEEFRVSLFAQELGTPAPVSAQRLATLGDMQ